LSAHTVATAVHLYDTYSYSTAGKNDLSTSSNAHHSSNPLKPGSSPCQDTTTKVVNAQEDMLIITTSRLQSGAISSTFIIANSLRCYDCCTRNLHMLVCQIYLLRVSLIGAWWMHGVHIINPSSSWSSCSVRGLEPSNGWMAVSRHLCHLWPTQLVAIY